MPDYDLKLPEGHETPFGDVLFAKGEHDYMELTKEQIDEITKDTPEGKAILQQYMEENDIIPVERLTEIKDRLDEAQEDDTPYLVVNDDKLHVIGDPNKTERKAFEYTLKFRFPKDIESDGEIVGNHKIVTRTYRNVTIKPRNDLRIVDAIMGIQPFIRKVAGHTVSDFTEEEMKEIVTGMTDDIVLNIFKIVAAVVDIKDELVPYMMPLPALDVFASIVHDFPEVFNETDAFFG